MYYRPKWDENLRPKEKKWPSTRFFVTAFSYTKLRSNRNQDQTL
jgi:hypothetical protein